MTEVMELAPPAIDAGFVDLVIGLDYGDEGKGKTVHCLVATGNYGVVMRFNGGANAGHQLYWDDMEIALHQVPSGIAYPDTLNIIGNGSFVDPECILDEFSDIAKLGITVSSDNLLISDTSHMVLPHHKLFDKLTEAGNGKQGTTAKGIRYVASEKSERIGVRPEMLTWAPNELREHAISGLERFNQALADSTIDPSKLEEAGLVPIDSETRFASWLEAAHTILPLVKDTFPIIHKHLDDGENILAEGAQSTGLDIDQGIYPLGTSSNASPGGMLNGSGVGIHQVRNVIGAHRMKMSRVGGEDGPLITRVDDVKRAARLRGKPTDRDGDFGRTSGRAREQAYPDNALARRGIRLGVTHLVLTQLDLVPRFGKEVKVAVAYDMCGQRLEEAPNSALKLAACTAIYETFPTWRSDISGIREYDKLPQNARKLVEFMEGNLKRPVATIGVGTDRDQVIIKDPSILAA